jgi:hypothetical protein
MNQQSDVNPWKQLPATASKFVLCEDEPYIDAFNTGRISKDPHFIHTDRMPEPRLGPVNAPLLILQQNPSCQSDIPTRLEICEAIGALHNELSPHFSINKSDPWWMKRYGDLVTAVGGHEILSQRVCSLEYFPYPSANFSHGHIRLPSQNYTFDLLRRALKIKDCKKPVIVVTRGYELWVGAVPELLNYNKAFRTNSKQCSHVSKGNLSPEGYSEVMRAIHCT